MKRNAFELPVVACLYVRMHSSALVFPSTINKVYIDKNFLLLSFDYFMLNVLEETLVHLFFHSHCIFDLPHLLLCSSI